MAHYFENASVVVVGAGMSGLGCAARLVENSLSGKVLVLEAQNRSGGRVFPAQNLDLLPGLEVDLGAEFVHGNGTVLHKYAAEEKWALRQIFIWAHGDGGPLEHSAPDGGAGYYYVGTEGKLMRFDELDDDLEKLSEALDELGDKEVDGRFKGWNLKRFLEARGLSRKAVSMAQAGYANTLGTSLENLSYELTSRIEHLWNDDGEEADFRIHPSCRPLVERLVSRASVPGRSEIRTSCVVKVIRAEVVEGKKLVTIEYEDPSGQRRYIRAGQVVVTSPLPILQGKFPNEAIRFEPPLPQEKLDCFRQLPVRPAIKIVVKFSKRFWPADLHGTICADCPIPEFWAKDVGEFVDARGDKLTDPNLRVNVGKFNVLVGFAMSNFASNLCSFEDDQVIKIFLNQLDQIFDPSAPVGQGIATKSFDGGFVFDWGKVPFIRCGYSFPSIFEKEDSRAIYARCEHDGRIFFAGEGSDAQDAYMTMHAAIRTGERAAEEILAHRKGCSKSKL